MAEKKEYLVDGFLFETEIEAKAAKNDENKIQMLDKKLNYDNFEAVSMVYNKALENHVFETIVGEVYLKKLQEHLIRIKEPDSEFVIQPITIHSKLSMKKQVEEAKKEEKLKVRIAAGQKTKEKLKYSVILNFALALIIVILFIITLKGENANILNYKNVITNKYASWEQDLQEREAKIREKEKELSIE